MGELTVKIAPPLSDYIEGLVASGEYASADEAVAGLLGGRVGAEAEYESPEFTAWLRREVQKGLDDIDAGRVVDWDPDDIMREVERRHAER